MSLEVQERGSVLKGFTCCEGIRTWAHNHPTILKVMKIVGLILAAGAVGSLPFMLPIVGASLKLRVAAASTLFILASLVFFCAFRLPLFSQVDNPAKPEVYLDLVLNADGQEKTFRKIDSSHLRQLDAGPGLNIRERKDFRQLKLQQLPPVLFGASAFVSLEMIRHLMKNKKDLALGVKYVPGDQITDMEGALHTFLTPICSILMTGDYRWGGGQRGLMGKAFGNNFVREVVLSAAIHPDFEINRVMMRLVKTQDQAIEGLYYLGDDFKIPSAEQKKDEHFRKEYDERLLRYMISHLSSDRRLPAISEINEADILNPDTARDYLKDLISSPQKGLLLKGKFMRAEDAVISLEILYNVYLNQLRNEFRVLNRNLPQGYVYTISPPSIFANTIGGVARGAPILNRLQALAFQSLQKEGLFSNLKILGFGDYADKTIIPLFQKALPDVEVVSQSDLFNEETGYAQGQTKGLALVIHNNSDGFGQNIEFEGATSLDGVIGKYSSAALVLDRKRPDLVGPGSIDIGIH